MSLPTGSVSSLYRSLLRESNKLPYGYLRAFYRFKFRDDAASAAHSIARNEAASGSKLKRLKRDYRKLGSAIEGDKKALARVLDLAYGRAGKLRRELLEPFLQPPGPTIKAEPIIPGVEKSRPPTYTREMTALLTSAISRTTRRVLKPSQLKTPPSLPSRADPSSEEARLLGRFSQRREVNLRWRFFTQETHRVFPPLEISLAEADRELSSANMNSDPEQTIQEVGLAKGGLQGSGLLESLRGISGDIQSPRKVAQASVSFGNDSKGSHLDSHNARVPRLPTRLLRRSHQNLLGKLPLLTYRCKTPIPESKGITQKSGSYEVTLARQAISPILRYMSARLPLIDDKNMEWIRRARERDTNDKSV